MCMLSVCGGGIIEQITEDGYMTERLIALRENNEKLEEILIYPKGKYAFAVVRYT